jgi:DNA protecting protein DprA
MTVDSREDAYLILNALPRIGWLSLQKLLEFFGNDPLAIFKGKEEDLLSAGLTKTACANLLQHEQLFHASKEKEALSKMGARFISFEHPDYPALLRTIYDPPIGLYVLGKLSPTTNTIAIVGSRYADIYGLQMAEKFSSELAERGWNIISGFARGIDTAAHRGALRVQGTTVAVLGCGIDRIYPPENADLYAQIKENGCIISEFPLHVRADRVTFPRRNRILSGMSQATLVVESDLKGGSMLTATFALEQNRQVFAIPGRIDSDMSRGCHQLIRNGATLVTSTEDILEDLDSAPPLELKLDLEPKIRKLQRDTRPSLEGLEAQVYGFLQKHGTLSSSDLCAFCKVEPQTMQTVLFSLELNRWIIRRNDGLFEL